MSDITDNVSWSPFLEQYFAATGERSLCLAWMHKRAEEHYSRLRNFIELPAILGSGIIAFLNAGSSSIFEGEQKLSSIALGIGSLFVGVINTLGSYFSWAKRAEGHRRSSIDYAKLSRFLTIEMSLPREERLRPAELLKYSKESYDRLAEVSPLIPTFIINEFNKKFEGEKEISKPVENTLEKIVVYEERPNLSIRVPAPSLSASSSVEERLAETPPAAPKGFVKHPKDLETSLRHSAHPVAQSGAAATSLAPSVEATAAPKAPYQDV